MKKSIILAFGLFLMTLMVYWPGRNFDYVWDDFSYVEHNEFVQNGLTWNGIRYAFEFSNSNWHPLVWLSLMADTELHGHSPSAFRTTNYLLHAANVVLLFFWLRNLTGRCLASLFVSAVFCFHPLHVESVQWISERKDVLSMFFGLWTLLAWQRYLRVHRPMQLAWVCLAYLASLMSKQMFVTLPVLLLLLDYWPLQRMSNQATFCGGGITQTEWFPPVLESASFRHLLSEKILLFAMAIIFCVVAFAAQRIGGSVQSIEAFPLPVRLANAIHTSWLYLGKALCPKNLIIFYPHPGNSVLTKRILAEFLGLVVLTAILMCQKQRRYLIVGWLWYLVAITPVIGLVQIGDQQMADRYAYLPMIGIYWACTWWMIDVTPGKWERIGRFAIGAATLTFFMWMTREQIGYWRNHMTLNGHMKVVIRDRE